MPRVGALSGLAVALAAMFACSSALAQNGKIEHPNLNFVVAGTSSTIYFTIPALARSLGYFKDEGLNVEWIDSGSGAKGLQALVGGSADVVTGSYEHTIHMQAKGFSIISIAAHNESTGNAMGVSKAKAVAMKNGVPDLKGAIVGISGPGSSTDMFAKIVVENTGIKREDVSYIAVGTSSAAVAALRGGKVDAVSNVDPVISELVNSGDMILVADGRSADGAKKVYGGTFAAGCTYVTADFLARNPNTVQAIANAIVRTIIWLRTANPDKIIATLPPQYSAANPALYKQSLLANIGGFSKTGRISKESTETVLRNVVRFDPSIDPSKIDLSKTYTNEFVDAAMKKYGP